MRAPGIKRGRRAAPATLCARLASHVTLEARSGGEIAACFDGISVGLGKFSAGAAEFAQRLRRGLPLNTLASPNRNVDKEIHLLVRRSAGRGLLEYGLGRSRNGKDQIVIEPQVPDYWPRTPELREADVVVLSRFAYIRRRANELVLESPRAGALLKICNPKIRPPWLCCRHRNKSGDCADIPAFRKSRCSPCSSTAKSCSRPALPAAMACDRPRATIASCFGTSTIFCSTRAAPRADRPIRWAGSIPMSTSFLRYRRCGRAGRETKSIWASSPTRILRRSRRKAVA